METKSITRENRGRIWLMATLMLFAEKSRLQPYAQCVGHLRSQRAAIGTLHGSLSVLAWREHRQTYSGGYTLLNGTTRKPSGITTLARWTLYVPADGHPYTMRPRKRAAWIWEEWVSLKRAGLKTCNPERVPSTMRERPLTLCV
jgi:hypothetical protein